MESTDALPIFVNTGVNADNVTAHLEVANRRPRGDLLQARRHIREQGWPNRLEQL